MTFKTTALAGDGVRQTRRHGHVDDAVAVLSQALRRARNRGVPKARRALRMRLLVDGRR